MHPTKQPYARPQLRRYGPLTRLVLGQQGSQADGSSNMNDGRG